MTSKTLTIRVQREPAHVIVTVAGEIDISTADRLRERLFDLAAGDRPVVADLDQVSLADATGLGVLVGAARRAAAHPTSLHVVCAQPQTLRLLRLAGLDRQIPVARTVDEALMRHGADPGTT